jgi:hypothetical protein
VKIEPPKEVEEVKAAEPVEEPAPAAPAPQPAPAPAPLQVGNNEQTIWNFLISQGFTREQTAGIMGNLQQEHNFKTEDVPGGLGIAQWIGGRRAALIGKGNYTDLNVQLNFLMEELNGSESAAKNAILASGSVEAATMAFSSKFERCGTCHNDTRIMYAYNILGKY